MRASGVNAAIMRVTGKMEKNAHYRNCAHCGSANYGVLLYLENRFASLRNGMKKNWRLLNNMLDKNVKSSHRELLINGIKTEDENIISKSFCEYFIEYSKSIHHSITTSQHDFSSIIPVNLNSNVFKRSSLVEITNMID